MIGHGLSQHITVFQLQTASGERLRSGTVLRVLPRIDHSQRLQSAVSSRIDAANAASRVCNSTLMITFWLAAVYLLPCSLALCCVIEFG